MYPARLQAVPRPRPTALPLRLETGTAFHARFLERLAPGHRVVDLKTKRERRSNRRPQPSRTAAPQPAEWALDGVRALRRAATSPEGQPRGGMGLRAVATPRRRLQHAASASAPESTHAINPLRTVWSWNGHLSMPCGMSAARAPGSTGALESRTPRMPPIRTPPIVLACRPPVICACRPHSAALFGWRKSAGPVRLAQDWAWELAPSRPHAARDWPVLVQAVGTLCEDWAVRLAAPVADLVVEDLGAGEHKVELGPYLHVAVPRAEEQLTAVQHLLVVGCWLARRPRRAARHLTPSATLGERLPRRSVTRGCPKKSQQELEQSLPMPPGAMPCNPGVVEGVHM